jgi:hypothetical protein
LHEQRSKEVNKQRDQTNKEAKGSNEQRSKRRFFRGFYGALSGWFANGVKNMALFAFKSITILI